MASEDVVPLDGYAELHTAPDHVIDMILGLMPAADPCNVPQVRSRRAEAATYANRIWAEAAHAGAAWGISRAPAKMQIDLSGLPALGDLMRDTAARQ